jgi:hypothetical protein
MKKILLAAIITVVVSASAFSQNEKKFSFSIGPELGFASGSFSATHSVGLGGTVQAEVFLQERLRGTITFGLMNYVGKSWTGSTDYASLKIIPLRFGAKYYLVGRVYAGAQLGVAFRSNYEPYSGTAFAYTPIIIGYEFTTKSEKALDASFKYDASSGPGGTIGAIGLRLAYVF